MRLLSSGLTDIKHADYSSPGTYYQAFFSLSVGLERICKLIITVSAYVSEGVFISDKEFKKTYSHDLKLLFSSLERLVAQGDVSSESGEIPTTQREAADDTIAFLADFGRKNRYYNLDFLTSDSVTNIDPLASWRLLVLKHFPQVGWAKKELNPVALSYLNAIHKVSFTREDLVPITSLSQEIVEGKTAEHLQRNGAVLCIRLIRFAASCLSSLSYKRHFADDVLPVFSDFCYLQHFSDSYVRSRRTFNSP